MRAFLSAARLFIVFSTLSKTYVVSELILTPLRRLRNTYRFHNLQFTGSLLVIGSAKHIVL